jgi:hypothetical protein
MLFLTTLVGALLGWKVRGVARQRSLVAAVKANDGLVQYDYEANMAFVGSLPGPDWLCQRIGVDYFASVESIVIPQGLPDTSQLAGLAQLKFLMLSCQQDDLSIVGTLANLRVLRLQCGSFTDLSPLEKLSRLEELHLCSVDIADEEVSRLQMALPHCAVYRESPAPVERFVPLDKIEEAELRAIAEKARSIWGNSSSRRDATGSASCAARVHLFNTAEPGESDDRGGDGGAGGPGGGGDESR